MPIFSFRKDVGGVGRTFEIVPSTIKDSESIYEADPIPGTGLTYSYRSDGSGDSSNNTGFFMLFKQGNMENLDFTQDVAITNFARSIPTANINNNDMWLYKLDQFGQILEKWSKVENKTGNNAIYNSLAKTERNSPFKKIIPNFKLVLPIILSATC